MSRRCTACWRGDCGDCVNYVHPDPWCLHRCAEMPQQLPLWRVGDTHRPGPSDVTAMAGPVPGPEEEIDW